MKENQKDVSIEENINSIYNLLYLSSLDDTMNELLSFYVKAYNETLEQYNTNKTEETQKRLKLLSGPLNFINVNFPEYEEEQSPHPAVDYIRKNIKGLDNGVSNKKGMTRVLKPQTSSTYSESEEEVTRPMNGFGNAIVVVILTTMLGILLGILLNYLK